MSPTPTRTSPDVETVRAAAAYADTWVALRRRTLRIPGVQVAVAVGDKIVLSSAHGHADVGGEGTAAVDLTTEHLFRIASHSKTFTATAVMQLVETGALRLDDTVGTHVSSLVDAPVGDRTVAELLAHGGGVVRDTHDSDFWNLDRPFPSAEALLAAARDEADVLPANERFKYSNFGYGLLGLVIEAASAQPYAEYVSEHIVGRLGLQHTGPDFDPSRAAQYATGYSALAYLDERRPIEHVDTAAFGAGAGFYSTADDLCRYAAGHVLGDQRLISDASKRRLHRDQWQVEGTDEHYGLGFSVNQLGDRRMVGHAGGFPGQITRTMVDPHDGLVVSVLTNCVDGAAEELVRGVVAIVDLALAGNAPGDSDTHNADTSSFTGRFANLFGVIDVVDLGGTLYGLTTNQPDPTTARMTFEVVDADTLLIADTHGYGAPGERVPYTREGGTVTAVRVGGRSCWPVEGYAERIRAQQRITCAV